MLNNYFFWREWSKREKYTVSTFLCILLISLIVFVVSILDPVGNTVRWDVLTEMSDIGTVVDSFRFGDQRFGVTVPSHLVTEQFVASTMNIDLVSGRVFLTLALLGLALVLAAVTTLPRFWYLAAMTVFLMLVAVSRLDVLMGGSRFLPIGVVVLFGGLSYYLHAFKSDSDIIVRIGAFVIAMIVATGVIFALSTEAYPGFTLMAYTYPVWLLLTAVFLLICATEIIAGLVWLSTGGSGRRGASSLTPFLVISLLYLFILLLMYLENTRRIGSGFSMVSPVILALSSGLLGIWGFRARCDATGTLMPFKGTGFWIYLGLFLIAAAFGSHVAAQANDPVLEVLEDVVVNGQLAMSTVFLFYIVANFFPLFREGRAVHKVLYKPMKFDLSKTRILGFTGVIMLFAMQNLLPVAQGMAGYFNGLGDLRTVTGEYVLAEQYYKMAIRQEFQNHKSNYALASLALQQGDRTAAGFYFKQATLKKPTPQAFAGLSAVLLEEDLFFDALFNLRKGLEAFPKSGELMNNLGVLYSRTSVTDSAFYYFEKAEQEASVEAVPATNILGLLMKNADDKAVGGIKGEHKDHLSWQANWLGYRNRRKDFTVYPFSKGAIRGDSLLSASGLAFVVNYSLNQARNDTTPARFALGLADKNPFSANELLLSALYANYYSGDKTKALQAMAVLADGEEERGKLYKKIMGQWFLQLGLYDQAIAQFSFVNDPEGLTGRAIATAVKGDLALANMTLDKVAITEGNQGMIESLRKAFLKPVVPVLDADSLYKVAQKQKTNGSWQLALKANPYDERIACEAAAHYTRQNNLTSAYSIIVRALQFNDQSARLYGEYAYLSLGQGLLAQADEGAEKVESLAAPADYQAFLSRYQAKRALIEKKRAEFK